MKNWTRIAFLWAALALAIALTATPAFAAGSSYSGSPLPGSTFQAADGNQDAAPDAGGSGSTDWQSYAGNGDVLHERLDQPVDGSGTLDYFYKGHESTPTDWIKDSVSGAITPAKSNALAEWSLTDPFTSDVFFYFSFLRESTSSADSFFGIELFHDGHLWRNGNTNTDGTPTEIPCRSNGDLMMSYEIDPSNKNVAINFYEWANGTGPTNSDPLFSCPEGATGDFVPANPAPAAAQAYMNFDGDITNYLNTPKFGNTISTGRFAEGAVNIDNALQTDLSDKPCFSFGYAQLHSRSSSSLDSAMQDTMDPVPVQVANCTVNIDKTVRVRTGDTESNPAPGGDTYADSASATVGQTLDYKFVVSVPSGSKSLEITDLHDVLGTATDDPAHCTPTSVDSGGFNIGDANQNSLVDAGEHWIFKCSYTTTNGDVARSPLHNTAFVTAKVPNCALELQYCGDDASDDASATVGKATPTLATTASNRTVGSEQTIGGTITDTATVSGGSSPTGTVTFSVYAPGDTTCQTALDWGDGDTSKTATLSAGQATSPAFTTSAVGTYRWVASYGGDANNNSVDGACNDPNEASLTKKATPALATAGSNRVDEQTIGGTITDTAHVTGGDNPTGSVTFRVYAPGDSTCATPLDWGGGVTEQTVALASGQATSPPFTTSAVGTYRWVASYSGDANNNLVNGACNDANEFSKTKKDTPSLATEGSNRVDEQTVGGTITDTAHVTGGYSPTGSVTFRVYAPGDSTCQTALDWGGGVTSKTVAIDGNGDATSPAFTTSAVGTYRWVASYGGDANNNSVNGSCNDDNEFSKTKKASPEISTQVSSAKIGLGHSVRDVATVSGGYQTDGGSVTFDVYGPVDPSAEEPVCDESNFVTTLQGSELVDGKSTSAAFTPDKVGRYLFVARYAGDANNNAAAGVCGDQHEQVDVVSVAVTVQKDPNDTHAYDGDKVSFTIAAKNVGTDSLKNVELKDQIQGTTHTCESLTGPTGDDGNDQLDPGETWTWICTVTVVHSEENSKHEIVNVAHIEGDVVTTGDDTPEPSDHVVSNEDDASVPVFHPLIAIDKTGPATGQAGDKIGYVLTVTNPGDIGFAESTVKIADQQCNGDPVALIGKGGDSSPDSLDPGDAWTFSCSVQTAVGDTAVHNVASVSGCDKYGKCVDASDSADTTLSQPEQLVLPERITPGTARLLGPTGCVAKAFNARVRGSKIATVTFVLDGKVIKRVRNTKNASLIQVRINPKTMRIGVHRLVVNISFQSGTGTKPKSMRLSFQRCAKKLSAPRFTG